MAIGMTYDQYWHGDCLMVRDFYKAWKIKQEQENEKAWLQGLYFLKALDATVGNAFRQKGAKAEQYPSKPIELEPEKPTEEKTSEREEAEMLYAEAYMMNMVMVGKNWGK